MTLGSPNLVPGAFGAKRNFSWKKERMGAVIHAPSLKAVDVESLSGYILSDGSSALVVRPWVVLPSVLLFLLTSWPLLHQQVRKLSRI